MDAVPDQNRTGSTVKNDAVSGFPLLPPWSCGAVYVLLVVHEGVSSKTAWLWFRREKERYLSERVRIAEAGIQTGIDFYVWRNGNNPPL